MYTIKQIFTSVNYTNILNSIQEFFSKDYFNHIKGTVFKSINCKNFDFARIEYQCPHCGSRACKPVTCKTKFCPCCSKIYTENWSNKLNQQMINQKHKHLLFTIPKELRSFFLNNRELLTSISDSLNAVFKDHFWKKYKITHFGYITFFHTFGRKSNFNPHLHLLITCGGFKESLQWKSVDFFPYLPFKNSWKYIVTTALKEAFPNDQKLLNIINSIWKNQIEFFIDVKGTEVYNSLNALKYLGRYLARPPLAEYRITHFDGNSVTFWYEQLPEKNKVFLELPVEKFIKQLVAHIPPKGFKMIRRYGIYSRNFSQELKNLIKLKHLKKQKAIAKLTWAERIEKWLGINPLKCLQCGSNMILSIFFHKKYGIFDFRLKKKI